MRRLIAVTAYLHDPSASLKFWIVIGLILCLGAALLCAACVALYLRLKRRGERVIEGEADP